MKKMWKVLATLLACSLLFSTACFAEEEALDSEPLVIAAAVTEELPENAVKVTINGELIEFDVPAQIIDDRTMVPMRKIFETLGATVDWIESERGIVAAKGSKIMAMVVGSTTFLVADVATGEENITTLDVPPQIVGDRTLVPVRVISESLGKNVNWNAETRTVEITD